MRGFEGVHDGVLLELETTIAAELSTGTGLDAALTQDAAIEALVFAVERGGVVLALFATQ